MHIKKIYVENFKCLRKFSLTLNEQLNIIVGDNEAGKSTILESIHLVLSGLLNGRHIKNEITQYLFNNDAVNEYLQSLIPPATALPPPHILIEVYMAGTDTASFEGDGNSEKKKECGIALKIAFHEKYQSEYEELVKAGNLKSLPIEYYDVSLLSFARESITPRSIPIKSALIDSSSNRYQNGSDMYISRILRNFLDEKEIIDVSQAHRRMKDVFMGETAIKNINTRIQKATAISSKLVTLSVDHSSKGIWENSLLTYLDNVPFHHIGKGEQSIVKTKLALAHKKSKEANLLLLEEPENHLSHTKLNELIYDVKTHSDGKQIIISTHNSFVANKLGLDGLILLNDKLSMRLSDLQPDTKSFFEKLPGYDTLRLILCKKAILVEGDCDELLVQKAYLISKGKLPIEDGIDVISVGTTFLRFLEIAEKINKSVAVVTDNDSDVVALERKYEQYLGANVKPNIKICFDGTIDTGTLTIGDKAKPFNYNTLEPKFLKANDLAKLNTIFGTTFTSDDEMHKYMKANKTECALKIYSTTEAINFPQYILDSIA